MAQNDTINIFSDPDNVEVMGIWNDKREEADFIVKGTPTYLDEKHKSFQGPVVDGKAKYARVLIKKKIVIMGEEVIHNNDTKINGKERYRRVCIRLIKSLTLIMV